MDFRSSPGSFGHEAARSASTSLGGAGIKTSGAFFSPADRLLRLPTRLPLLLMLPPLSYDPISTSAIAPSDWHCTSTYAPILRALGRATKHADSSSDVSHQSGRPNPPPALPGPPSLGHIICSFRCHCMVLWFTGPKVQISVGPPLARREPSRCSRSARYGRSPLCHHPSWSLADILCTCPGIAQVRVGILLDFNTFARNFPLGPLP